MHVFIHLHKDSTAVLVALSNELNPENVFFSWGMNVKDVLGVFVFLKNTIYRLKLDT